MGLFDDIPVAKSTGLFDDIPSTGEDVTSKLKNDQDFAPTPEEVARGYKSRFTLPDPSAFWEGAKHFVTETLPQQAGKAYDQTMADGFPNPISPAFLRKQALTGAETALRGTAYFGDMLANPLNAGIGEAAAEAQSPGRAILRLGAKLLSPNIPVDTVLPRTPEQQSAAEQIWASRTRVAGKDARAMTPYHEGEQSFVPGAMPAVAELGSNFVDPTLLIPAAKGMGLLKMAGKGAEAASIGEKMARVAEEAGNTGGLAKKAVEVVAPAAEKAAQAAGRGAELVGEGLDKVQPILDIGGLIKGGLPGAAGAHVVGRTARAAVKWASKVRDASTGLRNVAKADWSSSWTVAQQLAKDADAPAWLKRAASSSVAPAVESTIRGVGAVGEGALHGAAIGGAASMANDTLTSQERGEAMGAGGVLGVGGAALGRGIGKLTGRTAAAQQAHDQAVMSHEAIQGGADPASVFAASDATMYYAHSIKQLFKGAMPGGKDLAVRLLDGKQFGEAHPNDPGAVASFRANPDGTFEALINLDRPEADSRVLHEALGHALLESVVGNNPDAFERARSIFTPEELGLAGEQYATALHPELKGPDQQTWIAQQQANSLNKWGDRDAWILSELISEGAVKEAGGRSIRDMATPGFGMSLLRSVGLDKPLSVNTGSFFQGPVAAKLSSPELGAIVRGRVEELGRFRPGIDQPKENSITIQKGDWGKKPFAPLHDLEKPPTQPPPLPRDPSLPPPLNPPPPTKPPSVPKGNDFVVVNPTTGAVIPRPPAQTKQLVRNRQKAVDAAVPKDVAPAPIGDADTQVKLRTSPSGLLERSGTTLGKWFYDGNVFSETTKNYARKIEEAIKSGTPLSGFYHEIGESAKGWAKSVAEKYGNLKAEYKDFIPVGFLISNVGNLLMRNYSLTAFERKAQLWGSRKGPLSLEMYNGDIGEFRKDVQTYMRNHAEGKPGSDSIGEQKRDLINAFMVGGNRSFEATNPLRPLLRGEDRAGLVRSYRLDRLETIEPSEVTGFAKPSYEKQLRNLSPKVEQSPQDEIAGKIFGRKYSELFPGQRSDVDTAVAKADAGKPKGQISGQVKTPEFKQWFGDWEDPNAFSSRRKGPPVSVVVDSRGQPLPVFHSTRGDFNSFETGRKTANNYGFFGNSDTERHAVFFTDSSSQADSYSKTEGSFEKGSSSVPVFLDIKSPIDFTNSGLDYEQLASELGVTYNYLRNSLPWEHLDGADGKQFVKAAKRAGYDGMLFHEDTLESGAKPGTTYAVFDPNQIKSAIGNQGTFDAKNPDIRFSPKVNERPVQVVDRKHAQELFDKGYRLFGAEYDGFDERPTRIKNAEDLQRYDPENIVALPPKKSTPQFSPRAPKDEREVILNLTSATGTLLGLDRLTREASGGDAKAEQTLNGITHDALHLLTSGIPGVRVDIQDTRGVFGSSFEPAVQAVVKGTPESLDAALAAAERFARNFNQQEIHRREISPEGHYPGREHGDGSFDTPVFTFTVNRALTPGDITHLIEVSGLDALTQRGDSLEAYYANDPKNLAKIRQFERGIGKLADTLGDNLQSSGRTSARLWRYGTGENGTIPYERIRGDVRPEPTQQNAIAKRIAERLRGREVPGAPQAKEITPDQQQLQTRIAKEFESAPMNELDNPVVAKAYRELADELVTQYEHLPVKIEVLTGQGEPYKSSAEMRKDVTENNHLFIFGTTPESFGPEGVSYKGHPLLEDSGFKDVNGKPLLKNDLLRAVHDYYAHTITPVEFGPKGEEAAWKNHMQMTKSPWARLALTTETRGQNSAVNFGKNAEFNKLNKKDTIFADQKVTVLDPEFSKIGDPEADAQIDAIADQVRGRSRVQFSPRVPLEPTPEYLGRTPGARVYAAKLVEGNPHKYVNIVVAKKDTSVAKNALEGAPEKRSELYQRLDGAAKKVAQDPVRLSNPKGYVEYMRDAGVSGDVMAPPAILKTLIETPQKYVDLVMGGYHGDKTKPGSLEAAMSGLDSTMEMRKAIGEKPPSLVSALHHFWGILSRQATPLDQEAAWLRLSSQPEVLEHIQKSIDGNFDLTDTEWDGVVTRGMKASAQSSNRIGNAVTSNANSFYLMLNRWNGKWDRVNDIYAAPNSIEMGRRFWSMGEGPVGIKNKVQRFVGLTFGTPGLIMDRWKFVEFYMGQFGKEPRDFFDYSATGTPGDPASLYAAYGGVESANPVLSLAFYEGMETALGKAIENSPELKQLLGRHANVGGLHWVGWNAIKNEAVGHSSLNMTYDLVRKNPDPKPQDVLELLEKNEYFTEGLSGNSLRRFSLKNK